MHGCSFEKRSSNLGALCMMNKRKFIFANMSHDAFQIAKLSSNKQSSHFDILYTSCRLRIKKRDENVDSSELWWRNVMMLPYCTCGRTTDGVIIYNQQSMQLTPLWNCLFHGFMEQNLQYTRTRHDVGCRVHTVMQNCRSKSALIILMLVVFVSSLQVQVTLRQTAKMKVNIWISMYKNLTRMKICPVLWKMRLLLHVICLFKFRKITAAVLLSWYMPLPTLRQMFTCVLTFCWLIYIFEQILFQYSVVMNEWLKIQNVNFLHPFTRIVLLRMKMRHRQMMLGVVHE